MPTASGQRNRFPPHAFRELLYLGGVLVVYVVAMGLTLPLEGALGLWLRLLLLNSWLLAAALFRLRMHPLRFVSVGGGCYAGRMTALSIGVVALVLAFGIFGPVAPEPAGPASVAPQLLVVALVPIAEEIFFRGLLLDHLARNLGQTAAILLVSGLFGFLHAPQGLLTPMLMISLVLCLTALGSGSVVWAMALHVGWNACSLLYKTPYGAWRGAATVVAVSALVALILWGLHSRSVGDGPQTPSPARG